MPGYVLANLVGNKTQAQNALTHKRVMYAIAGLQYGHTAVQLYVCCRYVIINVYTYMYIST